MTAPTKRPALADVCSRSTPSNRRSRRRRAALVALAAAPFAAVACGGGDEGVAELRITAGDGGASGGREYQFELPAELPAGPTRMSLLNDGAEVHHAQLFRLHAGAAAADLLDALARGGPPAALQVGEYIGGTGLVGPGGRSQAEAIIDLTPANYVFLCLVDAPDGSPHVSHGMLQPFTVNASGASHPPPAADRTVELADYRFDLPDTVEGGALIEVRNTSTAEPHELVMARLDGDVTAEDVGRALERDEPMPAEPVGGMQTILPGAAQRLQLDLAPGRYVVLCAVPSPDGTAHHRKGMIQELTVT